MFDVVKCAGLDFMNKVCRELFKWYKKHVPRLESRGSWYKLNRIVVHILCANLSCKNSRNQLGLRF